MLFCEPVLDRLFDKPTRRPPPRNKNLQKKLKRRFFIRTSPNTSMTKPHIWVGRLREIPFVLFSMFTINGARPHACLFFLLVAHRCVWRYPGQQLTLSAACHASHRKHNDASYVFPRLKVICKSIGSILPSLVYTPWSHSTCTQDNVR